MTEPWAQFVFPSVIAGVFGIGSALLTAKLAARSERKRSEREAQLRLDGWEREFAVRYAEIKATNRTHADAIRQQFASACVYVQSIGQRASERYFIANGTKLTIGRATDCDIAIDDLSLSGKIALLEMQSDGLFVTDLYSASGIVVNGSLLECGSRLQLSDGDSLDFGATSRGKVILIKPL